MTAVTFHTRSARDCVDDFNFQHNDDKEIRLEYVGFHFLYSANENWLFQVTSINDMMVTLVTSNLDKKIGFIHCFLLWRQLVAYQRLGHDDGDLNLGKKIRYVGFTYCFLLWRQLNYCWFRTRQLLLLEHLREHQQKMVDLDSLIFILILKPEADLRNPLFLPPHKQRASYSVNNALYNITSTAGHEPK